MKNLFLTLTILLPARVFAAPIPLPNDVSGPDDIVDMLTSLASWVFTFAIIGSIFMALYAAFEYMTAGGDSEKTKEARSTLTYAAIGVAVAIAASGFPYVVGGLLGFEPIR